MLKKLTPEKQNDILETGIAEFAAQGPDRANINVIAKKSGVSVGVLYKYYADKEAFFLACLRHALATLRAVIDEAMAGKQKPLERAEKLIRAACRCSREHPDYNRMYCGIAASAGREHARLLAREIEGLTAEVYTKFIADARASGSIRGDLDPRLFAFFFDNLLMSLQFSYSCDYYRERFALYCGEDAVNDDDRVASELLKFVESAFTFGKEDVTHT